MNDRLALQDQFLSVAMLDCSSPHDGAIFFSGPRAKRAANQASMKAGDRCKTVLETEALGAFNGWQSHYFGKNARFSVEEAYFIGDCISERFAKEASGVVTIYLDGVKPHGTFARAELPTLLVNPDVDSFHVYDFCGQGAKPGQAPPLQIMDKTDLAQYIQTKVQNLPDRRLGGERSVGPSPAMPA